MAYFVELSWPADPTLPGPRKARAAFRYRAFVPDPVGKLQLALGGDLALLLSEAERSIADLNRDPPMLGMLEILARRLLRSESVASSRIEGLELSQRRLARAEAIGGEFRDETARTVISNVAAMEKAMGLSGKRGPLAVPDMNAIHAVLMQDAGDAGRLRRQQSWIGGNSYNPYEAAFVPPPPGRVPALMRDLSSFLNREDLPPLAQAAIAHAQFETIHPYSDGNGRVGRALIHIVLRRRGLAPRHVPPISLVLAGDSRAYIGGLIAFREGAIAGWCRFFAEAAAKASRKSAELAARFGQLQARWLERAGNPRADSSAAALIAALPAYPVLSVATAQAVIGRSKQAANEAIAMLEECGILKRVNVARRNRAWEAKEVFELLNDFERELATPEGALRPGRPAPRSGRGR